MAANDYSYLDLLRSMKRAGFAPGKGLINGFATSIGENTSRNLTAVFVNSDQWHSRDRGPWQINDHWHPEVSDATAFDLDASTREAFRISSQGTNFNPWSAFSGGRYKQFVDLAYAYNALDNALAEADDLAAQLSDADAVIAEQHDQLQQAQHDLADAKASLDACKTLNAAVTAQLNDAKAKIDKAKADLA